MLQAELCSTLKRRKNVAPIVDPPKYQYPQYNDTVDSTNVSSAAFAKQSPQPQHQSIVQLPLKPVVPQKTAVNIFDDHSTPKSSIAVANQRTVDRPPITHGKPNFTLPKEAIKKAVAAPISHSNGVVVSTTIPEPFKAEKTIVSLPSMGLQKHAKTISHNRLDLPAKATQSPTQAAAPTSPPPPIPAKFGTLPKNQSLPKIDRQLSHDNSNVEEASGKKLLISHGKPNFVVPSNKKSKVVIAPQPLSSKQKCENYLEVKIKSLKPQKATGDSPVIETTFSPNVSQTMRPLRPSKSIDDECNTNELQRALSNLRTVDHSKTTNWSGRSTPASELSTDSGNSSPPPSTFGRSIVNSGGSIQPIGNAYTNYEQKTVVSFSKELHDAPNRYPESIKVTKTITTSHHQTVFNNVKFVINDDGNVIHSNYLN